MIENITLRLLIRDKKWYEIVANYSPDAIVKTLSFYECIQLADGFLDEKLWDFDLHVYAAKLLENVRLHYPREWGSSSTYDVFLGQVCDLALDYDGRYEAFLRAYEKSKAQPHPKLLIMLAACYDCPGKSPISYNQIMEYLQIALKDNLYQDGIGVMSGACSLIHDEKKKAYWAFLYRLLLQIGICSPDIEPECLQKNKLQMHVENTLDVSSQKLHQLISSYTPVDLAQQLQFQEGLSLSCDLLYNPKWERKLQEYSVELLEALHMKYPIDWKASWKNDGFLATAYLLTLKPKKRYETLRRVFEQTHPQPPELLIAMASTCLCEDGVPPVSYDEAIDYLKLALKDHLYTDGVWLLFTIYELKGDSSNREHWGNVYNTLPQKGNFSTTLRPELTKSHQVVPGKQ